jgi:hypothetical protein
MVDPRAYELADGQGWKSRVYIGEDDGPDVIYTEYILPEIFSSESLAITAALQAGRNEVDKRSRAEDIRSVIREETKLPSSHRHGYGHNSDDVAIGSDGQPAKVPAPENPEDRFNS